MKKLKLFYGLHKKLMRLLNEQSDAYFLEDNETYNQSTLDILETINVLQDLLEPDRIDYSQVEMIFK